MFFIKNKFTFLSPQVVHKFKIAKAALMLESSKEYNDDKWHTVMISRQQLVGKLIINGDDEETGTAPGTSIRAMSVQPPFSFGGVNTSAIEDMSMNLVLNIASNKKSLFSGCITDIQIGGKALGEPIKVENVIPCSEQIENGAYFANGGNGFIKVNSRIEL